MSHPTTPTYDRREGVPRDSFSLTEAYSETGFLDKLQGSIKTQHVTINDILTAGKLLASLKGGSVACITYEQIHYKVGRDENVRIGRYYPFVAKKGVVSYQTMWGSLRRIIMADKYVEFDMKNAQPVLLINKYHNSPHLLRNIEDREAVIEEVRQATGCTYKIGKSLFHQDDVRGFNQCMEEG